MNVYRVKVEQWNRNGYQQGVATFDVSATTAQRAIDKAIKAARREPGWLKSQPVQIVSLDTLASQVL